MGVQCTSDRSFACGKFKSLQSRTSFQRGGLGKCDVLDGKCGKLIHLIMNVTLILLNQLIDIEGKGSVLCMLSLLTNYVMTCYKW